MCDGIWDWLGRRRACRWFGGEGRTDGIEAVGEVACTVRGVAQPFPGKAGELTPVGVVACPSEDFGGVAELLGELLQDLALLFGADGGVRGLQERVHDGGGRGSSSMGRP
ncbi:hypothetical protein ADL35_35440 [Streptomyces sp. NRRL WC-3753]|nr:hypothetical protein ADL35_35440 [Streptomyces sp. NRRL WC-3753]